MSRAGGDVQMSGNDCMGIKNPPRDFSRRDFATGRKHLWSTRPLVMLLSLICMVGVNTRAFAQQVTTISDRPAATLLLPYFQVNLTASKNAATTLFSIVNSSNTAQLAHVVINSDLSVHVLDFDVYLTGYGLYRINLSDLLINGTTPETGFTVSNNGPISAKPGSDFPGCSAILPLPNLSSTQLTAVQDALTGQPSSELTTPAGATPACAGIAYGDGIARGYITIDDVNECSVLAPGDPGYLSTQNEQQRVVTDNNVLWGDSFYLNPATNRSTALPLVHIVARSGYFSSGQYTFYGRYDSTPWNTEDDRQPLPTTFLSRYINSNSPQGQSYFNQGTSQIVWRDSKVFQQPFNCPAANNNPNWYGLGQEGIAIFDEQENVETPPTCHFSPCPPNTQAGFPAETQKILIGSSAFPTTFAAGWMWADLNHAGGPSGLDDPDEAASWVFTAYDNTGNTTFNKNGNTWEINERAIQLDSGLYPNHCTPNMPAGNNCGSPSN